MDAKDLIRRDTENKLNDRIDFMAVYNKCDALLSKALEVLPTAITDGLNAREILSIYLSKYCSQNAIPIRLFTTVLTPDISEDCQRDFVNKICHKCIINLNMDIFDMNYYTCIYVMCSKFGYLQCKGKLPEVGGEFKQYVDYFIENSFSSKGVKEFLMPDWEFGVYELIRYGTKKWSDFYNRAYECGIKWLLHYYAIHMLTDDKVNWNKPLPWISPLNYDKHNFQAYDTLIERIDDAGHTTRRIEVSIGEYEEEPVYYPHEGSYYPEAVDYIKRYLPENFDFQIPEDLEFPEITCECEVEDCCYNGIDEDIKFGGLHEVIASVLGIHTKTVLSKLDGKRFTDLMLVFVAYYASTPQYYVDLEIDKTKKRL